MSPIGQSGVSLSASNSSTKITGIEIGHTTITLSRYNTGHATTVTLCIDDISIQNTTSAEVNIALVAPNDTVTPYLPNKTLYFPGIANISTGTLFQFRINKAGEFPNGKFDIITANGLSPNSTLNINAFAVTWTI